MTGSSRKRIILLKRLMKAQGISALLVTRLENIRYLTGFTGSAGALLVASGKPCLVTDFRYHVQAGIEVEGIRILIQKKDLVSDIVDEVQRLKIKKLWFDEAALTVQTFNKLRKKGLSLKAHKDLVGTLRSRKDEKELSSIRLAIRRAEESFQELKPYIKPGITEREISLRLEYLIREKGSRKGAFEFIVASGSHSAMPHAGVTNRRIRQGDLVTIDFGAEADGYYSDMTRTVCVGKPLPRHRQLYELVLQAQAAAIQKAGPGISCKAVDQAAREVIRNAGHAEHFGHGTGHGIGLMVHESPSVSFRSDDVLEQGMVCTIEPGIYVPGFGGVRIEDMILVTETGTKRLTTLPRELDVRYA